MRAKGLVANFTISSNKAKKKRLAIDKACLTSLTTQQPFRKRGRTKMKFCSTAIGQKSVLMTRIQ